MDSECDIYDANLRDVAELYKAGAGEELANSLHYILCGPPYNVERYRELENPSHVEFGLNDADDLCKPAETLMKCGGQ